jgi:DNA-binding LacI/PurR family transcriptional regulator
MARNQSRTTSFDVAALAGVSQSVVSRAFTPGSRIAAETREKVIAAARKLNYVPNSIASSLTTKRTNIVALILGNLANPFYVHVLHAFSKRMQDEGRQLLVFTVDPGSESDEAILHVLKYQVDGVILTAAQLSTRMISLCHDRGIPIVLFNRYIPGSDASCVRCDNAAGGRLIADAFLAAGAKSFAMITGDPRGTTSQDRVRGFVERLLEDGVKRSDIVTVDGQSSYEGGAKAALEIFSDKSRPRPDALFGINDIMCMGAMDTLRGTGLRIPEDLMVGGFDDIPEGRRQPYQLTSVRQPIRQMVDETLAVLHLDEPNRPIERGIDRPIKGRLVWGNTIPAPAAYQEKSEKATPPDAY